MKAAPCLILGHWPVSYRPPSVRTPSISWTLRTLWTLRLDTRPFGFALGAQNGADIKHIEHARKLLKPGGRLVAICANGPRQRERLQPIAIEWRDLPPGSFKDSGTNVNAAMLVMEAE